MNPDLTVYTTLGSFQNQNDKRTFKTTIPANEFTKEQSLSIAGLDDLESNEVVVVVLNRNQTDLESNKPLPYHATNNNNNNNILPNENKRKNPGYPGSDIAFYILLVGFTAMYTLSTLLRDLIPNKDPNIRLFFAALGTISLVTAPLVYLYKTKMNLRKMLRLKKEKADSQIFRYSIIISFGMVVDILLLSAILLSNSNSDPKKDVKFVVEGNLGFFLSILAVVILPGFCEEIIFRGFFQKILENNHKYQKAIIITSFLFSFMHFDFSIFGFLYKFFLGYFYGILALHSNSCYPSIISHMINNGCALLLPNLIDFKSSQKMTQIFIVIFFLIAIILVIALRKFYKTYPISKLENRQNGNLNINNENDEIIQLNNI